MRKLAILLVLLFSPFVLFVAGKPSSDELPKTDLPEPSPTELLERSYNNLGLEGKVSFEAYKSAMIGYSKIENRGKDILTLIDFSLPSTSERLFVIDVAAEKVLFHSVVAHGRNSGGNYATSFSNVSGSHKSSLGFYLTANTYKGRNGYSLILEGLEKGFNDKARQRAIVVHGAAYANPDVCASGGRLGRSFGCPALPHSITRDVIDTIKDGSVMFIYANQPEYLTKSAFLM